MRRCCIHPTFTAEQTEGKIFRFYMFFVKNVSLSDGSLLPHHSGKHDKLWNVCFIANNSPDGTMP